MCSRVGGALSIAVVNSLSMAGPLGTSQICSEKFFMFPNCILHCSDISSPLKCGTWLQSDCLWLCMLLKMQVGLRANATEFSNTF